MKKLFLFIILLFPTLLISQPVLSVRNLDYQNFPIVKAEIRATYNSQFVPINQNNLFVFCFFVYKAKIFKKRANGYIYIVKELKTNQKYQKYQKYQKN